LIGLLGMVKVDLCIEIVRTSTTRLSSLSQISAEAILSVLTQHFTEVHITVVDTSLDLEALVGRLPDLVFLGMNFVPLKLDAGPENSDGIWVTDYLDENGIAYTGSGQIAHELAVNKALAKQCVMAAGLNTSPFLTIEQGQPLLESNISLGYPVFIKPLDRGGGLGIDCDSVALNFDKLSVKVQAIADNHQSDSIIEEYLPGREFSVSLLKDLQSGTLQALPVELIAPADKFGVRMLSKQVKSLDAEKVKPVVDENLKEQLNNLAVNVFNALGGRDYGRIDIRLDRFGVAHFLEANLMPSLMSGYGSFPKSCALNIGMDYEQMILSIVQLGLRRNFEANSHETDHNTMTNSDKPVFAV